MSLSHRCFRANRALDGRSDAEEEAIESVRASIETYLAKYSEGVARKEAAIIQARDARAECTSMSV